MRLGLSDGDRVGIVGGGPGGSFAALHLLRLARQAGLHLEVRIFEPRDFNRPGPGGCNRCAGVLSSRLLKGLEALGIALPEAVIQSAIDAYAVHIDGEVLRIEQPDSSRKIVSIYRGGGPRLIQGQPLASFDGFMLQQACAAGAVHVPSRVRTVVWEGRPVVHTARERYPAELLVLATGVNSRAPLDASFGYRPPKTAVMAQDEVLRPLDWPLDQVSAFFREPPGLIFGAMIPKGRYLNISLLGRDLPTEAINDFIEIQGVDPDGARGLISLCGCTPRIAVRPARRYYGDRWVAVGDAAVTRLYKDGIGSAFFTTQRSMEVALRMGIASRDFRRGYAPYCRRIAADNNYGRMLYRLWQLTLRVPRLLHAWKRTVKMETALPPGQRVHARVLWGMFTGDEPYRDLLWLSLSPFALAASWLSLRRA